MTILLFLILYICIYFTMLLQSKGDKSTQFLKLTSDNDRRLRYILRITSECFFLCPGHGMVVAYSVLCYIVHSVIPSFCHSVTIHFPIIILTTIAAHIQLKFDILMYMYHDYTGRVWIWFWLDDFFTELCLLKKLEIHFHIIISKIIANIQTQIWYINESYKYTGWGLYLFWSVDLPDVPLEFWKKNEKFLVFAL